MLNSVLPQRRTGRLKNFDYSNNGFYFITLCCYRRFLLFGDIVDQQMQTNALGCVVALEWQKVPERFPAVELHPWVLMPNHFHAILALSNEPGKKRTTLGSVVGSFKSLSQKAIRGEFGQNTPHLWQRGYYDHVIRNDEAYQHIANYVQTNPQRWQADYFNVQGR
ncbi:transposase [Rheinheimera sediminis]|uniref:transposase n=1 Tax=Rheinheimera sp. YQF-1 TaxID=2499626 RepID=UPI000FD74239|nr:transposase [Rheinheimera sp. YQF-1]RVT39549.1 transposase [Rheinheimera sp. YQF-1]